jgi:hypothetical protein
MREINETIGLCDQCYRHIPAIKFERDGAIWLGKICQEHGYSESLIEPDAEFYLKYKYPFRLPKGYFIDITNKCNLKCPHCYQMPDNSLSNRSVEAILDQILSWEDDGYGLALAGAEPTVRRDLDILVKSIADLSIKPRRVIILSNGVNLSSETYVKKFKDINNLMWTIGLNHPDYHGAKIRSKQMAGIHNCISNGIFIKDISYTLEDLSQLEYCLEEIQELSKILPSNFRIRCGADIGRNPDMPQLYLSQLVYAVKEICDKKSWSYITKSDEGIRAHYPVLINDVFVKIIQWPDVSTIDLEEMQTEAWGDLLPGYPISPLVHQVILRDALINNNMPLLDTVPKKYRRHHD